MTNPEAQSCVCVCVCVCVRHNAGIALVVLLLACSSNGSGVVIQILCDSDKVQSVFRPDSPGSCVHVVIRSA